MADNKGPQYSEVYSDYHGTADDVVVWQHSILYQKAAVDKGVQLDYYMYPGHPHNVIGKDRSHLMEKITNYFIDNL